MSTHVSIIYPMDPCSPKADGIQTCIKDFIKYAPENFAIELIGLTTDALRSPLRKWQKLRKDGREFDFFPLLEEKEPDKRKIVPLSLRFVAALAASRLRLCGRIFFFHRLEPALLFRKTPGPKVAIVHNDIERQVLSRDSEVLWSRIPGLYFFFEKRIFASLDAVYTVSRRTLEFYRSRYADQKDKFSFLPVWVDMEKFAPADEPRASVRQRLQPLHSSLPVAKKWVLFVGRLQEQKAPQRLLESFSEYHRKDSGSVLIVLGEGNARKNMERRVKGLGLEPDVFFLGSRGQDEVADLYRAADCLLLASHFEGMPRCVLEALASGLPVVSTDVGEIKRVVKADFSGEVAQSFAPRDLAVALDKVLGRPSVYSRLNCVSCVSEYSPQRVLGPVYEKMRSLEK